MEWDWEDFTNRACALNAQIRNNCLREPQPKPVLSPLTFEWIQQVSIQSLLLMCHQFSGELIFPVLTCQSPGQTNLYTTEITDVATCRDLARINNTNLATASYFLEDKLRAVAFGGTSEIHQPGLSLGQPWICTWITQNSQKAMSKILPGMTVFKQNFIVLWNLCRMFPCWKEQPMQTFTGFVVSTCKHHCSTCTSQHNKDFPPFIPQSFPSYPPSCCLLFSFITAPPIFMES